MGERNVCDVILSVWDKWHELIIFFNLFLVLFWSLDFDFRRWRSNICLSMASIALMVWLSSPRRYLLVKASLFGLRLPLIKDIISYVLLCVAIFALDESFSFLRCYLQSPDFAVYIFFLLNLLATSIFFLKGLDSEAIVDK